MSINDWANRGFNVTLDGTFFTSSDLREKSGSHKAAGVRELKLALANLPSESSGRTAARRRTLRYSIEILTSETSQPPSRQPEGETRCPQALFDT